MKPTHNPKGQEVRLPAVQLAVTGLKAQYHILCHTNKFQRCPLDAGMDLYPSEIQKVTAHGVIAMIWVHTFLVAHIPPGCKGVVEARSSSPDKLDGGDIVRGIIDAGYTGELMIRVKTTPDSVEVVSAAIRKCQREGVAIAQLLVEQSLSIFPNEPNVAPPSLGGRGPNGFGHTDSTIRG